MKAWNSHLLSLLFIPLLVLGANSTFAAQRPNVIIVMTDDQGYPELSAHGNPVLQTPHLDRLHEENRWLHTKGPQIRTFTTLEAAIRVTACPRFRIV